MQNETLINKGRDLLKELLTKCTEEQKMFFKRMYSPNNLSAHINEAVDNMDSNKIDWAISQTERTLDKNPW